MSETLVADVEAIAQASLDAYNAQALDRYCSYFTADVVVADYNGPTSSEGIDAYRARYAKTFETWPENRADLVNRMVFGKTVIDHERVYRSDDATPFDAVVIYTFRGDKIARVDFVK